jgi:DNA-binding MarR family transcriptional regulator
MTVNEEQTRNPDDQVEELTDELLRRLDSLSNGGLRNEISFSQYRMLSTIHRLGPLPIGKAADLLGSAQSTTSEMMTRLLKSGLITKDRGQYDGRVVTVEVTDQGRQLIKYSRKRIREAYQGLCDRLSPAERDVFLEAMKQLNALMGKGTE